MKCYWLCLHDTYITRKLNLPSCEEVEFEFISPEICSNGTNIFPLIIEGKKLNSDLTDIALKKNGIIFIENFIITWNDLKNLEFLAKNGIPLYWNFDDLYTYIKLIKKIEKSNSVTDLVNEIIKLESSFHSINVSELSFQIVLKLHCQFDVANLIRQAALLHDVGKLILPRSFINSPRWYTPIEREYVKFHTFYGENLVKKINTGDFILEQITKDIVLNHHERNNGTGYPLGKDFESIPLSAKIVAVVDVYDALRTNRPYRSACDHDLAITYIKGKSQLFDKDVVEILEEVVIESSDLWVENERRGNNSCL